MPTKEQYKEAIEFIDEDIKNIQENEGNSELITVLKGFKEQLEIAMKEGDEDFSVDGWGDEIYNATIGGAGYGDTDYSDNLPAEVKSLLGLDEGDDGDDDED